jgi:hypothetical protein
MNIEEHWRAAELYAGHADAWANVSDDPQPPVGTNVDLTGLDPHQLAEFRVLIDLANMHYRAASAAALFAQHYPGAWDRAMQSGGPAAAREVAKTYPGAPGTADPTKSPTPEPGAPVAAVLFVTGRTAEHIATVWRIQSQLCQRIREQWPALAVVLDNLAERVNGS